MTNIKNRNLIVTETFDEFSLATEDMDFSVEDLVAYVNSVTNVFYWLNVESVWGRLGFVWDKYDSSTRQGYGHFVHTTIPFSVIPSLPDGERIVEMNGNMISTLNTSDIILLRSNWENLNRINAINGTKNLVADLTGAPLSHMIEDRTQNHQSISRLCLVNYGTLYLKADFSNCEKDGNATWFSVCGNGGTFIVDDNNKYLNIPAKKTDTGSHNSDNYKGTIYWKGEGPFKFDYIWRDFGIDFDEVGYYNSYCYDTSEYFYHYSGSDTGYKLKADSNSYFIPNTTTKTIINGNEFFSWHDFYINLGEAVESVDITLDCSSSSIVVLSQLINRGNSDYTEINSDHRHSINPVQFIGNVTEIDYYNPFIIVDGAWPEYDAELASKVIDSSKSALIYCPRFVNKIVKCPYNIDVTNRNYFSVYLRSTTSYMLYDKVDDSCNKAYEGKGQELDDSYDHDIFTYNMLPTFTGMHRFKMLELYLIPDTTRYGTNISWDWGEETIVSRKGRVFSAIPSVEADIIYLHGAYVPSNCKIKANKLNLYDCCFGSSNSKSIYFYTTQEKPYYTGSNLNLSFTYCVNKGDIDLIEFESLDDSVLNASNINTLDMIPGEGKTYLQPFVLTTGSIYIIKITDYVNRYFNPSYIFIKSGISLTFEYTDQTGTYWTIANVKRLIHSIKKVDGNTNTGTITLVDWMYDALVSDDPNFEEYVGVTLGYRLLRTIIT